MGKSMYNFGKNAKEKARQQKQMEKASRRLAAKKNKANIKAGAPGETLETVASNAAEDITKDTA